MARANVVALHSFSDDEALMWLSDHLEGRVEMSLGDLAQQFGWSLARLRRRLAFWADAGRITQFAGSKGKVILAPTRTSREAAMQLVGHAFSIAAASHSAPPKPPRSIVAVIMAGVLFADRARADRGRPGHERALCRLVRPDRGGGAAARRDRASGRPARGGAAERRRPVLAPAIHPGRRVGLDHLARGAGDDIARRHGLRVDQYRRCGGGPRQDRQRERAADRAHRPAAARARRHFRDAPGRRRSRSSCRRRRPRRRRCGGSPTAAAT